MILILKHIIPKDYIALTVFPFIILKSKGLKQNAILLNHENIHIKQQMELLIIPFFIWYALEFVIRFMHYKNWNLAYRNISFEREAYANENDLNYSKKRPIWSFVRYIK